MWFIFIQKMPNRQNKLLTRLLNKWTGPKTVHYRSKFEIQFGPNRIASANTSRQFYGLIGQKLNQTFRFNPSRNNSASKSKSTNHFYSEQLISNDIQ